MMHSDFSNQFSLDGRHFAIAPGFPPTELTAPVFGIDNSRDWAASQTTIGRNGELEDSSASSYITGQTLHIDGGPEVSTSLDKSEFDVSTNDSLLRSVAH